MEALRATEESFVIVWGYIYVCTRVKNYVNLYSINEISIFQKFKVLTEDIIDVSRITYQELISSDNIIQTFFTQLRAFRKIVYLQYKKSYSKLPSPSSLNNKMTTKLCPLT